MSCKEFNSLIDDYLQGSLGERETRLFEQHLSGCRSCRREVKILQTVIGLSKNLPATKYPWNLYQQIAPKLPDYPRRTGIFDFILFPSPLRAALVSLAVILVLGFSALLTVNSLKNGPENILVEITVKIPEARTVALAGDFNGWDPSFTQLKQAQDPDLWQIELSLKPGRYKYMLLVDGTKWMPDPEAWQYVNDEFGGRNSILEVRNNGNFI